MEIKTSLISIKFLLAFVLVLCMLVLILQYNLVLERDYIDLCTDCDGNSKLEVDNLKCETIHIGFEYTSHNYNSSLHLYTMLKSLLSYRNNPLHFHIIVDDMTEKMLKVLFETWGLTQVTVIFYNVNNYKNRQWCASKTQYCTTKHKLFKLAFPELVSANTSKIIVIDTDLYFISDIYELWKMFRVFNSNQVLGMIVNEDRHNLTDNRTLKIPKKNRFDTSVIVYNLDVLKTKKWSNVWSKNGDKIIFTYRDVKMTDEDIINQIANENSDMIYPIPCQWNPVLNNLAVNYNCLNHTKVIRWNSSINVHDNDKIDYYNTVHRMLVKYDGYLLRQLGNCKDTTPNITWTTYSDECSYFHEVQTRQWRTLLFFRKFEYSSTKHDITFVSQLSYNRINTLVELSKRWKGPISVTFYISDSELLNCLNFIENSKLLKNRFDIAYHAVFKNGMNYPINVLRNVALRNVITPFVFLVDIDFLPAMDSYTRLKDHISNEENTYRKAFVVPAFESRRIIPESKIKLIEMWDNQTISPFQFKTKRSGHFPTNYTKWKTAKAPYQVTWKPEYEPYVIVQKNVTEYDIRFFGYGWNKISHIMELYYQKYQFVVIPDVFLVHKQHLRSADKNKFLKHTLQYQCIQKLKKEFVIGLKVKYDYPHT